MFLSRTPSAVAVLDPAEPAGESRGGLAREDLAAVRAPAETRRDVQRGPAVGAVLQPDGLAGIDADAHAERQVRIDCSLLVELLLQVDRRPERPAGRRKDGERLVASNVDDLTVMSVDAVVDELCEPRGQPGSGFVPVLLCVPGVAADVRDHDVRAPM
jgi:hypothetical protein